MYKRSKFNYTCKNEKGELLIYNTFVGAKSISKITDPQLKAGYS
jgi:hypothetical protein